MTFIITFIENPISRSQNNTSSAPFEWMNWKR